MLSVLHIENIAVIEQADILFDAGLNVLTGETGAGKSIIIDALGAVLGGRTSRELVRSGTQTASVTALFSGLSPSVCAWLLENGFPEAEDNELTVQRDIHADGRNVCRVGGRVATVAQLRELGSLLISISGQNDSYTLLAEHTHLEHVDRFAQLDLSDYKSQYANWQALTRDIAALQMDEAQKERRIGDLQYAIDELEAAELESGEEEELEARRKLLKNGVKLQQAVSDAYSLLYDDGDAAYVLLTRAEQSLRTVSGVSEAVRDLLEQVEQLRYSAESVSEELGALQSEFDFSPEEQDEVESRLALISSLKRKYGGSVESALRHLENSREELENITFSEQRLEKLHKEEKKARKKMLSLAEDLSKKRTDAARALERRITGELAQLDMTRVRFEAQLESDSDTPRATGIDTMRFLIATNVGEPLKPIAKVASGGELARILLALKNVLAGSDDIATLVFDEVDAGVSGRAAQKVAEKMSDVARDKQVLSVTHLPQIAAMADSHFLIEKGVVGDRTVTRVDRLPYAGRVDELARIVGGAQITETTRKSAAELIDNAKVYKVR